MATDDPPPAGGDPEEAVLILIDVVEYTPQAGRAGGPATRALTSISRRK